MGKGALGGRIVAHTLFGSGAGVRVRSSRTKAENGNNIKKTKVRKGRFVYPFVACARFLLGEGCAEVHELVFGVGQLRKQ